MNHKKGLTLIEVLVVVTILSVLALSVYTVFKSGLDAWSRSEARLDIYQNGRAVLDQISRELVGAFVDGVDAKLEGIDGGGGSDTLTFITDFSDSIYKIRYYVDATNPDPDKKILKRDYIDYSIGTIKDYASTDYDESVEFVKYTTNAVVSNIKFTYLPVMPSPPGYLPVTLSSPTGMADWNTALTSWSSNNLPEAVKIVLTLKDANNKDYVFETIVYLPNSESEVE